MKGDFGAPFCVEFCPIEVRRDRSYLVSHAGPNAGLMSASYLPFVRFERVSLRTFQRLRDTHSTMNETMSKPRGRTILTSHRRPLRGIFGVAARCRLWRARRPMRRAPAQKRKAQARNKSHPARMRKRHRAHRKPRRRPPRRQSFRRAHRSPPPTMPLPPFPACRTRASLPTPKPTSPRLCRRSRDRGSFSRPAAPTARSAPALSPD